MTSPVTGTPQTVASTQKNRTGLVCFLIPFTNFQWPLFIHPIPVILPINIQSHIDWLEDQMRSLDKDWGSVIQSSPVWKEKEDLLKSVPGVGNVTVFSLLADFPELGELDRKQIRTLAGLVPWNRDSGVKHRSRSIWGGRARL